ncbi:hypothetical protein Ctob_001895 [Chrysochromulina tobinii]|uniref:Uncharacterized protein n=1 Tax=Chrysochromulina tobinii TaxID=1460289 RepID=A0A0M0JEJ5_9EUKA|nr:hypothetical protein Ctob_001895 [Chrysochromulina tobinii]|eukprot:KOO24663.1 hypothetical protein Ctob_001895 [Chrysochromulina sp. CCMP291]
MDAVAGAPSSAAFGGSVAFWPPPKRDLRLTDLRLGLNAAPRSGWGAGSLTSLAGLAESSTEMAPIHVCIKTSSCGSSLKRYTFLYPFITKVGTPSTFSTD